jgi:hypothetical protein
MNLELSHVLLIVATILPFFYKLNLWLYFLQKYNYSSSDYWSFIQSKSWRLHLINFWFLIEVPLLLASVSVFYNKPLEFLVYPVIYYYLLFFNIFVIGKIFRKTILLPSLETKSLILLWILFVGIYMDIFTLIYFDLLIAIYSYVMSVIMMIPFLMFFIGLSLWKAKKGEKHLQKQ